jgi:hypothetical protein
MEADTSLGSPSSSTAAPPTIGRLIGSGKAWEKKLVNVDLLFA